MRSGHVSICWLVARVSGLGVVEGEDSLWQWGNDWLGDHDALGVVM